MDRSLKWAVAIVITLIFVLSPVFFQGCGANEWNPISLGSLARLR